MQEPSKLLPKKEQVAALPPQPVATAMPVVVKAPVALLPAPAVLALKEDDDDVDMSKGLASNGDIADEMASDGKEKSSLVADNSLEKPGTADGPAASARDPSAPEKKSPPPTPVLASPLSLVSVVAPKKEEPPKKSGKSSKLLPKF